MRPPFRRTRVESLKEYVSRVMREKRLTAKEIERRSDGGIGDSHVINVANGITTNLTLDRVKGLALGLGVDPVELFRVAIGLPPMEINLPLITRVFEKLSNPDLARLLIIVDKMSQKQLKAMMKTIVKNSDE